MRKLRLFIITSGAEKIREFVMKKIKQVHRREQGI